MERDLSDYDFPCSATFRHFYAEEYCGQPRIDYEPRSEAVPGDPDYQLSARLDIQERRINHLYALSALRQVERAEAAPKLGDGLAARFAE